MVDARVDSWMDQASVAVVAHGLLQPLSVITGAIALLRHHADALAPDLREELLARAEQQAEFATDMLRELARGLPAEALAMLDALHDDRP